MRDDVLQLMTREELLAAGCPEACIRDDTRRVLARMSAGLGYPVPVALLADPCEPGKPGVEGKTEARATGYGWATDDRAALRDLALSLHVRSCELEDWLKRHP